MTLLSIIDIDKSIFTLINRELTNSFLDSLLFYWRNQYTWIPVYIFIISYVGYNLKRKAYWFLFFLVLNFGMTDFVSSKIVKPLIERPRPCHVENETLQPRLLITCGSGYSFTSSHAANHFGIAFFLIFALRKRNKVVSILLFLWAFLVGYAQIYVGVHFPLDIIGGALLGVGIALISWEMYNWSMKKMAL
ncbi:phosphatase PAP2 family protein [Portibacter lacus]|uniref:Phosphatidic acid phosphatase type 2/haloperoxidase domain-containing protein n=1 Tax=Portibacter lacus TaxID=1099794 RepID=A0AA37SP02_9BACT|nr:phosphatase PAP2 family protein [Portibacter lacus]GLR15395.1 hypothetical protein GCM10007940_00100 [Portibacter lacus]